jgi:hypothetical protein
VVKVRAFIVMVALAGCGEPTPLFCLDNATCSGGQCIDQFCADSDFTCASGFRFHESAGEKAGECTNDGSGNGGSGETFDDTVTQLVPGEAGGSADASTAQDDITPSCAANPTGRDVMFEITVPASYTRLYVDTFQTQFDVVLAVYEGSCASITAAKELGCVASGIHACDQRTMQWSANVRAGVHCIVVDQAGTGVATTVRVRGMYGPSAQTAQLGATTTGTTCGHNAFIPSGACAVPNGPDETWFFMACPGLYTAMTSAPWPGDIEARTETVQYDCEQADVGADINLTKPGPVWLIAHQASGTCGTVSLDIY